MTEFSRIPLDLSSVTYANDRRMGRYRHPPHDDYSTPLGPPRFLYSVFSFFLKPEARRVSWKLFKFEEVTKYYGAQDALHHTRRFWWHPRKSFLHWKFKILIFAESRGT